MPPHKKRKFNQPDEIVFDVSARQEYLTGYHKRKEQRKKHAQEIAAKQGKEDRLRDRRERRNERKKALEQHLVELSSEIRKQNQNIDENNDLPASPSPEGPGEPQKFEGESVGYSIQNDEYNDDEKYTTVTVEPLDTNLQVEDAEHATPILAVETNDTSVKRHLCQKDATKKPKKKKMKYRYESKAERHATRQKQIQSSRAARARRQVKS